MTIKSKKIFGDIPQILSNLSPWWLRYALGIVGDSSGALIYSYLAGFLLGSMTIAGRAKDMSLLIGKIPLYSGLLIGGALGLGIFRYFRASSVELGDAALRRVLLHHMLHLPIKTQQKTHSGNWIALLVSDSGNAIKACDQALGLVLTVLVSSFGAIAYIFSKSVSMGWATLGAALISLICNGAFTPWLRKMNQSKRNAIGSMTESLTDLLAGHTTIRANNLTGFFKERYLHSLEDMFYWSRKISVLSIISSTPAELSKFLIDGGIMASGVLLLSAGKLSSNELMICWSLGTGVGFTMRRIGQSYVDLQARLASADRVALVLKESVSQYGRETTPLDKEKAIELSDIHFSYTQGKPLFQGVSMTVNKGEKVAFVGGSGGGKTTAVALMLRFYDTDSGLVRVFGRDVKDYTAPALSGLFAYVPQLPHMFDATIYENIAFGNTSATREQVELAVKQGYVDEFIGALPEGYDTKVGERGVQLSGGQRQRIAIARAFLKNAPILLLDEATASLDSNSEKQIQEALKELIQGRTIIMVAHRLSTTTSADNLYVLEEGEIVEKGSHEELLALNGKYAMLWNTQMEITY
ncbi:MAG TPA: ABC transporter ATP-binding protein [Clostridiaceae bacterium]